MLAACIDSVLAQDCDFAVEILVHDDASPDASADLVERHYPKVRLIRSSENVGFCVANNRMAALAQGKYLLLLNNDAALFSDALKLLSGEAARLGRPAILGLPQYDAESGSLIDIGCRLDLFLNPVPNLNPETSEVGMVIGACLWIDKALWNQLEGFPPWFGSIGEDLYLCCRARLEGHSVRVLADSGYRHHVGQSFGGGKVKGGRLSSTFRRRALSERNKTFVMAVVYPSPFMHVVVPVHLLLLLVEGGLLSLLKGGADYLRTIYLPVFSALIERRQELSVARKVAQATRRIPAIHFFRVFEWVPYKLRMLFRYGLPAVRG